MGICCGEKSYKTDNELENKLREILYSFHLQKYEWKQIDRYWEGLVGVSLLEIEDFEKWVKEEDYNTFCKDKVVNGYSPEAPYQEVIVPSYKELLSKSKGNLHLVVWMIGLLRGFQNKIEVVDKIIKLQHDLLNFLTFQQFLWEYLQNILLVSTEKLCKFFVESEYKNEIEEVKETFTKSKVEHFLSSLMNSVKNILVLRNKAVKIGNLEHEFIQKADLSSFFSEHSYLLDAIDLREAFFSKYVGIPIGK